MIQGVNVSVMPDLEASGEILVTQSTTSRSSILLVLPLPVRYDEQGRLQTEAQAANGLERWADNFEKVTAVCVLTPEAELKARSTWTWRNIDSLSCADRVRIEPFPWAYKPRLFAHHYRESVGRLRQLMAQADYLFFGISYSWGDWASLGCVEAIRQHRPYAVWTDLVDYQVIRFSAGKKTLLRRLYVRHVDATLVKHYHHYLIGKSKLGLFHGRDCYDAYAPVCSNPHVVHNIHLKRKDAIPLHQLESKAAEIRSGSRLKLGYVGRADASKGAWDWLGVVENLVAQGVDVDAAWLGDGPMLKELRAKVESLGLADRIRFPGFISDRDEVMEFLRDRHILLFCHKVPESPRVLIEALVCGTPIVGYDSPYPRDLISEHTWGKLSPQHDVPALTESLVQLNRDRDALAAMVRSTTTAADMFNDEAVFRHRSDLIKKYL